MQPRHSRRPRAQPAHLPRPLSSALPAPLPPGVAEFESRDEMETVIRKLDDTEFKNPFEQCFIRITEDRGGGGG